MQPLCQQVECGDVESEIVNGEVGAVTITDFDPVNFESEWNGPMQSCDRDGEIRRADRPLDGSGEPGLAGLRLQQAKTPEKDNNQKTERDAEPAQYCCRDLHQKA